MTYRLLLVDAEGLARTPQLIIRQQREFPGGVGISVHFRPVRNDLLFESAKVTGQLAYRILTGEGLVRLQLWVEYEVLGPHGKYIVVRQFADGKWKLLRDMFSTNVPPPKK
jgi:hypothetical protein